MRPWDKNGGPKTSIERGRAMTAPIPIRTPDIGLEDADDNALYDARKAALGAGGVILSPHMR